MRLSLYPDQRLPWAVLREDCREAEADGWDGLWLGDHLLRPRDEPPGYFLECWTGMAALAASIPRVKLGSLVGANSLRHPGLVAAMAVTMHAISNGRFVLGIGAGGDDEEHAALGIPFPPVAERVETLSEACKLLRAMLTPGAARYIGPRYTVDLRDTGLSYAPRIPLLVGGAGTASLRVVAEHADQWAIWGDPRDLADRGRQLDRHCRAVGREPAAIERIAIVMAVTESDDDRDGWPATLQSDRTSVDTALTEYAQGGVGELVVCDYALPRDDRSAHLRGLRQDVNNWLVRRELA